MHAEACAPSTVHQRLKSNTMKLDISRFLASYRRLFLPCKALLLMLICYAALSNTVMAQFDIRWMDVGALKNKYGVRGAIEEARMDTEGMHWPAELLHVGHTRAEGFWVGVKDWINANGDTLAYSVARMGPREIPEGHIIPVSSRLVSRWAKPEVSVNGLVHLPNFEPQKIDEIDPNLPADQLMHNVYRTFQGVEIDQKIYAFSNEHHDDYHLIVRTFTNTGNIDADPEVELPGQTLNEVLFFNVYRWMGRAQAAWSASTAQAWGKFNMVDIVGDGNGDYPVDFTAIYSWAGFDPDFSSGNWDILGSPMLRRNQWTASSDTTGRLAGMSMQGLVILHADNAANDKTYDPLIQPKTLGWMDMDEVLAGDDGSEEDYYELGILTRENPINVPGGSSRMFPHYANRIEPSGNFWEPQFDASTGKQGGHGSTVAYGPYTLAFNETITVVEALVANGLSYEAADFVGQSFKRSGFDDDLIIEFDANGDGQIDTTPFNYDVYDNGTESQTKNQWFLSARDSMFKAMNKARLVWEQSQNMSQYPMLVPPQPPASFDLLTFDNGIELNWETHSGAQNPQNWEIHRTTSYADNLPYERIATLDGTARSYFDTDLVRGVDYYYYLQAVGATNAEDPDGLTGTPGGLPLKSSRYVAQTTINAFLFERPEIPPYLTFLEAPDGYRDNMFASNSMSMSGNRLAVGAEEELKEGEKVGGVYIFERRDDGSWSSGTLIQALDAMANQKFGHTVFLDGDHLFVSAYGDSTRGHDAGALYVFNRLSGDFWAQTAKLVPDDLEANDNFGYAVDAYENWLIVNAPGDDDAGEDAGAGYLYQRQVDNSWRLASKLTSSEGAFLRAPLAIDDKQAFMRWIMQTDSGMEHKIQIFAQNSDGLWAEAGQIESNDSTPADGFGTSLVLDGNDLLVGANNVVTPVDFLTGAMYAFIRHSDNTWEERKKMLLFKPTTPGVFPNQIAIDGNRALASTGTSAFVYQKSEAGEWGRVTELEFERFENGYYRYGNTVALSGNIAVVGATGLSQYVVPSAYAFDLSGIQATSIEEDATPQTDTYLLDQNYPNPFRSITTIPFHVPRPAAVKIELYNVLGQRIRTVTDRTYSAGQYQINLEAEGLPSGTYFYKLIAPDKTITRSLMVLK